MKKTGGNLARKLAFAWLAIALAACLLAPWGAARAADWYDAVSQRFTVGSTVGFGHYEQSADGGSAEVIEWTVKSRNGTMAMLVANKGLDCVKYNSEKVNVTWETSSLRSWLNDDFFYTAFDYDERNAVSLTWVDNSGNTDTGKSGGYDTWDYVYILSLDEVRALYTAQSDRLLAPTAYAKNRGSDYNNSGYCWWWLRSPGSGMKAAVYCDATGYLEPKGTSVDNKDMTVRPAIWVDLSADAFEWWISSYGGSGYSSPSSSASGDYPVGATLTFGRYEQNADGGSGEPIEWTVKSRSGSLAMLVANRGLDCVKYNSEKVNVTWETSSLRSWLNNDFFYSAFTYDQRSAIVLSWVDNSGNSDTGKSGGYDTWDYVYILSLDEVRALYTAQSDRLLLPTPYARSRGSDYNNSGYCWWWLRSPGSGMQSAAYCDATGYLEPKGAGVNNQDLTVRPVIWVDLDSYGFDGAYASSSSSNSTSTPSYSGSYIVRVKNSGNQVNVRSGPGLGYNSLGTLYFGTNLPYLYDSRVDDRGVTWFKCRFREQDGWVSEKYTEVVYTGY